MTLAIRAATSADLPAVLALYAQPEIDDGAVLPLADAEAILARFATYPDYRLFVAEDGGSVVGSFALLILDNLGHLGAKSGLVEDVVVDPARHGDGIGKAMMRHAAAECAAKGCYKLALSSNLKRDAAHAFYDSLGFERHGLSFRVIPGDVR
jgi:ribosomal protein S18 acetylase RimI-like enzyme